MANTYRIDVHRLGVPIGRFCCRGYEPYSPRDPMCKKAMATCGHNPGYKSTNGIACFPAKTRNTEHLQRLKALLGEDVIYD